MSKEKMGNALGFAFIIGPIIIIIIELIKLFIKWI